MMFHSPLFILGFLPLCLAGFFTTGTLAGGRYALGWLIASVLVNHAIAHTIRRSPWPRAWMIAGVALNLAVLGWFKYADFLLHVIAPAAPALGITLPLAISFFTFQQIMMVVDAARGGDEARAQSTAFIPYAAFVTFFPHLIAGPIVRPAEIIPQLTDRDLARPRLRNLSDGLLIFLLGLAKKCVLADTFGGFADTGFAAASHGAALTFFEAWYATLSYALQIYFDFSGYSDMAIGLARMLNVRFPLNFDSPYQARDIAAFWRRWHITLGAFLRNYLYIPLGGNRHGTRRQAVNLMATMLLAGLWHGAGWNFVAWGGLHGLFLVIHAQYRRRFPPMPALLGQALTLTAVILAWVPFRAASFADALAIFRGMAGLNGIALPQMIVSALPTLGAVATPVPLLPSLGDARTLSFPEVSACLLLGWMIVLALPNVHSMSGHARTAALTAGFAFSVQAAFFAPHIAPFVYFQF
jgi:alginate O-acetyltransferase complex protein AlgI